MVKYRRKKGQRKAHPVKESGHVWGTQDYDARAKRVKSRTMKGDKGDVWETTSWDDRSKQMKKEKKEKKGSWSW